MNPMQDFDTRQAIKKVSGHLDRAEMHINDTTRLRRRQNWLGIFLISLFISLLIIGVLTIIKSAL